MYINLFVWHSTGSFMICTKYTNVLGEMCSVPLSHGFPQIPINHVLFIWPANVSHYHSNHETNRSTDTRR